MHRGTHESSVVEFNVQRTSYKQDIMIINCTN